MNWIWRIRHRIPPDYLPTKLWQKSARFLVSFGFCFFSAAPRATGFTEKFQGKVRIFQWQSVTVETWISGFQNVIVKCMQCTSWFKAQVCVVHLQCFTPRWRKGQQVQGYDLVHRHWWPFTCDVWASGMHLLPYTCWSIGVNGYWEVGERYWVNHQMSNTNASKFRLSIWMGYEVEQEILSNIDHCIEHVCRSL